MLSIRSWVVGSGLLVALGVGCGGTESSSGTTGGSLVGAWYGTGPDGIQCVVVCPNGKLFQGDRACNAVTEQVFNQYLPYTASGATLAVSTSAQCWIANKPCGASSTMTWNVSGDSANVSWCGAALQLSAPTIRFPPCATTQRAVRAEG